MNENIMLLTLALNLVILVLCIVIILRLKLVKYLLEQPIVKKLSPNTRLRPYTENKSGGSSQPRPQNVSREKGDKSNRNKGRQNRNPRMVMRNERPKPITIGNQSAEAEGSRPFKETQVSVEKAEFSKPETPRHEPVSRPVEDKIVPVVKETVPVRENGREEVKQETATSQEQVHHGRRARVVQKPKFSEKLD